MPCKSSGGAFCWRICHGFGASWWGLGLGGKRVGSSATFWAWGNPCHLNGTRRAKASLGSRESPSARQESCLSWPRTCSPGWAGSGPWFMSWFLTGPCQPCQGCPGLCPSHLSSPLCLCYPQQWAPHGFGDYGTVELTWLLSIGDKNVVIKMHRKSHQLATAGPESGLIIAAGRAPPGPFSCQPIQR